MPKKIQAPPGFQCPYQDRCPHLDGLSTHWVWTCYQEHPLERAQLLTDIAGLRAELRAALEFIRDLERDKAQLQAQLHDLHRKQFKPNRAPANPQDTPAQGAESSANTKKRGAPKGHPPWTRPVPKHIDQTLAIPAPKECPHCQCRELRAWPERNPHLQEDIVLCPKTVVTCFDHQQAWCPDCRRPVVQAGPGEMLGSYIGPVAKSTAVYLRYGVGISYRNVQKIFADLFGLSMVPASVVGFDKAAAARADVLYQDLQQKIQASAYLHADETSWRVDGNGHWLWYAGHEQLAYFHIDAHRSGEAALRVIGSGFNGVLNTDDYAAYNPVSAKARQSCLAHPLRLARDELKSLQDHCLADAPSRQFLEDINAFLTECCELGASLRQRRCSRSACRKLKRSLVKRLKQLCASKLSWHAAEELRCRLLKQFGRLFTFVDYPKIQPTNNQAEQSLRRNVIMRKLTFGNRSDSGAHRHSVLSSLITTAQRQERDPRKAFEQILTQPSTVAQRAFYRKSCRRPQVSRRAKSKGRRRRIRPK